MVGLALEGGGVRGSYQAGVIAAMYECNIKIDGVCGTSIGALNGAIVASGKGYQLPYIWRHIKMNQVFGFNDELTQAIIAKKKNLNFFKLTIATIIQILRNKGIEVSGIKKVIDEYLDEEALFKSPIDFGLCTVKAKTFKPLYLFKEDMDPAKIKDYIIASAFLPFFKREKLIDDNYYLDGGFYDLGPVNMLLDKGYDTVYLVKVHGIGISRPYDKSKNVIVIESKRKLGGVIDLDPNRIEENIQMGYYDAIRILKHYDGEKYVFKPRSEAYYKFLNRQVDNRLYHRLSQFFKTSTYKDTTIKALEYVLEHEHINYYKIYNSYKMIRYVKKHYQKDYFIYKYLKKLKHLI